MPESQAGLLLVSIFIAGCVAAYWKRLVRTVAVIALTIFAFGALTLFQMFHDEPTAPNDEVVKTDTSSQQG
jgi:hypothetical protein